MQVVGRHRRLETLEYQRILRYGGPWRTYTVRNLDAWYQAYDVKPGQKLYLAPEQRVRVW